MPQKKNYDCLELVRGNLGIYEGYQLQIQNIIRGLMFGYNRDFQLVKGPFMNACSLILETAQMIRLVVSELSVHGDILSSFCSEELYATEEAYELVKKGTPFREAYKTIGKKYI